MRLEECSATINTATTSTASTSTAHTPNSQSYTTYRHNHRLSNVPPATYTPTYESNGADDCSEHSANMYCSGYVDCDCNGSSCYFNTTYQSQFDQGEWAEAEAAIKSMRSTCTFQFQFYFEF